MRTSISITADAGPYGTQDVAEVIIAKKYLLRPAFAGVPYTFRPAMTIPLPASKSLANRALVIQALAPADSVTLHNVSDAQDTQTMVELLGQVADGATPRRWPGGHDLSFPHGLPLHATRHADPYR